MTVTAPVDRVAADDRQVGRVLIVDDSAVNRKLLVQLLGRLGLHSIEVEDGAAALAVLHAKGPAGIDVVLLDVVMPELDGYETLAAIKADETLRDLPVIMVSGVDGSTASCAASRWGRPTISRSRSTPQILGARINASLAAKRLRDLDKEYLERQTALTATIERQREELSRFLSPQVAALVSSPHGEQLLAGHRRQITAVFCDLRGFTAFAGTAEPEELFGLLRDYHEAMGALIVAHGGTLEHFAGDEIMIFFNDPVLQPDHVERGVRMAVAMRERFADLAVRWRRLGYELAFGVGIAVGYATLGRIGFDGRFDYGAIGNAVILASRLSSEAKGGQILLSQRAFAAVEEVVEAELVGELTLKGFSRPVPAVDVLALRNAADVAAS